MRSPTRLVAALAVLAVLTGCHVTSRAVSLAGDAHSSQDAQQRATVLLNRVYVPGAVRIHNSVLPPGQAVEQNQVTEQRSFTVLGRAAAIIAALKAQPPAGLVALSPQVQSTATQAPLSSAVAELRPAGRRDSAMQTLAVAAQDLGGGRVGLRVQAVVGWVGNRTRLETIPAVVANVQLGIAFADEPDSAMSRNNQMTATQVHELTARLNALPAAARDQYALCTQPDVALAALTLSYGGHQATFDIQIGACDEVDVTVDGLVQPLLGGDQAVSQEVASILNIRLPHV